MKSKKTLRILSLLGFLLLIAPFYQQCTGIKRVEDPEGFQAIDTTDIQTPNVEYNESIDSINEVKIDTLGNEKIIEPAFYQKIYYFIDDESNQNAFELALNLKVFFEAPFEELIDEMQKNFKKNDFGSLILLTQSFSFIIIILISFFNCFLVYFHTKNLIWIRKLSIINLFFIFISLISIIIFDPFFETYKQIKWGYYAFTAVQIAIWYISKKNITRKIY